MVSLLAFGYIIPGLTISFFLAVRAGYGVFSPGDFGGQGAVSLLLASSGFGICI